MEISFRIRVLGFWGGEVAFALLKHVLKKLIQHLYPKSRHSSNTLILHDVTRTMHFTVAVQPPVVFLPLTRRTLALVRSLASIHLWCHLLDRIYIDLTAHGLFCTNLERTDLFDTSLSSTNLWS